MKQKLGNEMRLPFIDPRVGERKYCRFVIPPGLSERDFPDFLKQGLESTDKQFRLDHKFAFETKEGADQLFQWWCTVFEWMARSRRDVFETLKQRALISDMLNTRECKETKRKTKAPSSPQEDALESNQSDHQQSRALVPLSDADLKFFGLEKEERVHDLRLAERLGYVRPRDIRELIERKKAELEDVGILVFQAPYGTAGETANREGGYLLNFRQSLLVAMAAETKESRATRRELAKLADACRRGEMRQSDQSSEVLKTLREMQREQMQMQREQAKAQSEQTALVAQALNAVTTMMGQRQPTADVFDIDGRRRNVSATWRQWTVVTDGSAVAITQVAEMVETFSGVNFSFQKIKDWVTKEGGRWEMLPVYGDKKVTLLAACPSHLLEYFCATVDDVDSGLRGAHIKYRMACTREGARNLARLIVDDLKSGSSCVAS